MNEQIREGVRIALAKRNMNRVELARAVGVSPQYLSQILNGQRGDVPEAWQRIFDELGLELVVKPVDKPVDSAQK